MGNKLMLFGGTSVSIHESKPFMDTFMIIHIDKESMQISEEIDFEFESEFGADSIDKVLRKAFLDKDESENEPYVGFSLGFYDNVEYFAFSYCLIGYQLFLFGGYCQHKLLHSVIIYDFMQNEWSLSDTKIPKEISKSRVVLDTNENNLHVFAIHASQNILKRDYKHHYIFRLKELC